MQIGIFRGPAGKLFNVEELIADAKLAHADGFHSYWVPQMPMGVDALLALSHVGMAVPEIELGTAVIPTYLQHPISMAQRAVTVTSIIGNRLALGIGLSHLWPQTPVRTDVHSRPNMNKRSARFCITTSRATLLMPVESSGGSTTTLPIPYPSSSSFSNHQTDIVRSDR